MKSVSLINIVCLPFACSSAREPSQVFTLLETIYGAFDRTAKKHGVFKVETIGDCYLCVTGLPEPQADHAVRSKYYTCASLSSNLIQNLTRNYFLFITLVARFANACLEQVKDLTSELEVSLGPDTADIVSTMLVHDSFN